MENIQAFDQIGILFYQKIQANDAEIRTLAETRDYLLPRLMSGEVRVQDVALEITA
jgi:type I restriction enzyme S subunit